MIRTPEALRTRLVDLQCHVATAPSRRDETLAPQHALQDTTTEVFTRLVRRYGISEVESKPKDQPRIPSIPDHTTEKYQTVGTVVAAGERKIERLDPVTKTPYISFEPYRPIRIVAHKENERLATGGGTIFRRRRWLAGTKAK